MSTPITVVVDDDQEFQVTAVDDGFAVVVAEPAVVQAIVATDEENVVTVDNPDVAVSAATDTPLVVIEVEGPRGGQGQQGIQGVPGSEGPSGPPGTGTFIVGEIPFGGCDGDNVFFTTANPFTPGSTGVFRNGIRGVRGYDYSEQQPNLIIFDEPPTPGTSVTVDYVIP